MCGQFELSWDEQSPWTREIRRRYAGSAALSACRLTGTARPGETLPALARGRGGQVGAFFMRWGFQMEEKGPLLINARSEGAAGKPLFSDALGKRRCLIPAACYYEWQRQGGGAKQKFALAPANGEGCYLAGLYRYETDRRVPAFVVLTRAAERDIAFLHSRMPVLLGAEDSEHWLDPQADPQALLARALRVLDAVAADTGSAGTE